MSAEQGQQLSNEKTSSSDLPPTISSADIQPDHDAAPTLLSPDTQENRLFPAELPSIPGYAITGELGRGGVGIVYNARHIGLNRPTAIKMLSIGSRGDPRALIRFLAEAEAVVAIRHKNVVQIYDYGDHQGNPYLALELCPGGSISNVLEAGKLEPTDAAKLIAAISEGVAAAHELGIIHRDLKPANILLDAEGKPKVTDFGLAKRGVGTDLTQTKAVMGTPSYMSPEQAVGDAKFVGPQTDIWALGVILYECLTGDKPFQGDDTWQVLKRVMDGNFAAVRSVAPEVPRDLALVCEKCLRRTPHERYSTAAELAADLQRFLAGKPIEARPVPQWEKGWKWAKRNKTLAAALAISVFVLLAGTLVSTWQAVRASNAERAARERADRESEAKIEAKEARLLAEAAAIDAKKHEVEARRQETDARNRLIRFRVATGANAADKGEVWEALAWYAKAWQDDPDIQNEPAHRMRVASTLARTPKLVAAYFHNQLIFDALLSPDGSRLVAITEGKEAWLYDSATQAVVALLRHEGNISSAAFSGDGKIIAIATTKGEVNFWDAASGKVAGEPLKMVGPIRRIAMHPNKPVLAAATGEASPELWDLSTRKPIPVAEPLRSEKEKDNDADSDSRVKPAWHVGFSTDGSRVTAVTGNRFKVYSSENGSSVTPELMYPSMGSYRSPIKEKAAPAISSDGGKVVSLKAGLVVCTETATGKTVFTTRTGYGSTNGFHFHTAFSPDNTKIFTAVGWSGKPVRVLDAKTGQLLHELPHPRSVQQVVWSPDSKRILSASAGGEVYLWNAETGKQLGPMLKHGVSTSRLAFTTDGKRALVADLDGTVRLWEFPANAGLHPHDFPGGASHFDSSQSQDGRFFVKATNDGILQICSRQTGLPILHKPFAIKSPAMVCFSEDNRHVLVVAENGQHGQVHEVETGNPVGADITLLKGSSISDIALSHDGKLCAAGGSQGRAEVYDCSTGRRLSSVRHSYFITKVSFDRAGSRLATAGLDRIARVWNAETGEPLSPQLRHGSYVHDAAFSPDSRWLVTASADKSIRLWDIRTGDPLIPPMIHTNSVEAARFGRDGQSIHVMDTVGKSFKWDLPTFTAPATAVSDLAKLLTGTFVDDTDGLANVDHNEFRGNWEQYRNSWFASLSKVAPPIPVLPSLEKPVSPVAPGSVVKPVSPIAPGSVVTPDVARKAIGLELTVEFTVLGVGRTKSGGWVMLNSMKDYKHADNFTAAIKNGASKEKEFGLNQDLVGRKIHVTGKVELFQKNVQIIVENPTQLEILPP